MSSADSTKPASLNDKLLGLELIRFVSAVAVLVWHYGHFSYVGGELHGFVREQQPFYPVLKLFYEYGYYGVQFFWCISGFIFFWKYREKVVERTVSGKQFFILRFSRLYPLHFSTLILVAVLQLLYGLTTEMQFVYQTNDFSHFVLQLFMASNWVTETQSFNGPIWSVSVEILVYVAFFLQLRFIGSSIFINILAVAVCILMELLGSSLLFFSCMAFFYIGGIGAIIILDLPDSKLKRYLNTLAWTFLIIWPVIFLALELSRSHFMVQVFLISYAPTLIYCAAQSVKSVSGRTRIVLGWAGNMTYSSYLLHFPIQLTIVLIFSALNIKIPFYSAWFFIGFLTLTLLASYYTYYLFEHPCQNWIRRRLLDRTTS